MLSETPTIPTNNSEYEVHILVTLRDKDENLVAITESTNARYLPSLFTEKWWQKVNDSGNIIHSENKEIFTKINPIIPEEDYLGMLTLERSMSGYNINIFEIFIPMIQV